MLIKQPLATGAGGFVGAALVRALILQGKRVRGLLKPGETTRNLHGLTLEIFVADILNEEAVREVVQGVDCVFHTASLYDATPFYASSNPKMFEVNVRGTKNLLEASLAAGVKKFIYTGSTGAVGLREDGKPAGEDVKLNRLEMRSQYEKSKAEAEALVLSYHGRGMDVVSVDPTFLVGPGDLRPSPTGEVILNFLNGWYPSYFDGIVCLSDLTSTVRAHLAAMEKGRSGERYIVSSDRILTLKEFFQILENISGIKMPQLKIPIDLLLVFTVLNEALIGLLGLRGRARPLMPFELVRYFKLRASYDSSKAKRELDYRPEPIEEELQKAVRWFMIHGGVRKAARIRYYKHIGKI